MKVKLTAEYRFRPPLKYLIVGICGLVAAIIFGMAIGKGQIWFTVVMGLFGLMTLVLGLSFLILFFNIFNVGNLKIGEDYIEVPGRWKKRVRLNLTDIISVTGLETYDTVIEIKTKRGVHLVGRSWMRQKDFDTLKMKFLSLTLEN